MSTDDRVAVDTEDVWPVDAEEDEAVVLEWYVDEGSDVDEGDLICEIQVEKANVDVHAPAAGTLSEIRFKPDEEFDHGETLAYITTE